VEENKENLSDNAKKNIEQRNLDIKGNEPTQFNDEHQTKEERYNQEKKIDEALKESFPASDPPAHSNFQ